MELNLQKISYKNIRDFHDLKVPLIKRGNKPFHISLIQMPNGTGKTTTIDLIRSLISGRQLNYEDVMSYRPRNFSADEGMFELSLFIDSTPYTIRLELDYIEGTANYKTSRPSKDGGGLDEGFLPPEKFKNLMTEQFTKLFIFDGELSTKLLDKDEIEAESSLALLYFLDRIVSINNRIEEIIEEERKKAQESTAHKDSGLKLLRTNLKKYETTLKKLQNGLITLNKNRVKLENKLPKLISKRNEILGDMEEILKRDLKLQEDLSNKNREIKEKALELFQLLRIPSRYSIRIHKDLKALAKQMTVLKMPKTTSSEFFHELIDSGMCICGTEINEAIKTTILNKAKEYLTEDSISIINAIKHSIRDMGEYEDLVSKREELTNLTIQHTRLVQEKDELKEKLSESSKEKITKIDKDKEEMENRLRDFNDCIEIIQESDTIKQEGLRLTWKDCIPLCQQKVDEFQKKIREAAQTVRFEKKANFLKEIINQIKTKSLVNIKEHVIEKSNQRIEKIMKNKDAIIDQIEGCIKIHNKDGISQGQSLAVAYSFLATLFEESPYSVPFVIDSPAGSLDIQVRREVSKLIPSLFNQLVIFIISSEREGFIDGIEANDNVQYYTIYKNPETPKKIYLNKDINFFMSFHSEEEL